MAANEQPIRSLLVPLADGQLLVPGSLIAEVVDYIPPRDPPKGAPEWLLGESEWRGQRVPCVAFEALCEKRIQEPGARSRLVVLKAVSDAAPGPYIALRSHAIPRLLNVEPGALESLQDDDDASGLPPIDQYVLVQGEPAFIPDVDEVERTIGRYYTA